MLHESEQTSVQSSIMEANNEEPTKKPRRARFPEDASKLAVVVAFIPSVNDFTDHEIRTIWFDEEAFHTFKTTAKQIALQARRFRFDELIISDYEGSQDADPLLKWARHGHSRRGLEQWVNPSHGDRRLCIKEMTLQAVLNLQHALRQQSEDKEVIVDELANVSRKYSMNAAAFAERLGRADAYAVRSSQPNGTLLSEHRGDMQCLVSYVRRRSTEVGESQLKEIEAARQLFSYQQSKASCETPTAA
jgi:hypothetical protein